LAVVVGQIPKVPIRFFLQLLLLVAVEEETQLVEQTSTAALVEVEAMAVEGVLLED
jgi:hypothetical protein